MKKTLSKGALSKLMSGQSVHLKTIHIPMPPVVDIDFHFKGLDDDWDDSFDKYFDDDSDSNDDTWQDA